MTVKGIDYVKSAERWQEYGRNYHREGVVYYAEGNKTALAIATILIGFIGVSLQFGDLLHGPLYRKILIFIAFISSLVTAITGLLLFTKMNEFLNKAGDYYERLSENLFHWMFKNKTNYGDKYPKEIYKGINLEVTMNNIFSHVQTGSVIVAFICITIYVAIIFFGK